MRDDGGITEAKFREACKGDVFKTDSPDPGAPSKAASSFTESQVKDRVEAAGYIDVSGLTKDDAGVWPGNAKKGEQSVQVAVDFKGNVVSQ